MLVQFRSLFGYKLVSRQDFVVALCCSDVYVMVSLSEDSTDNNDVEVAAVLANGS